ncbi:polysaccharide biosynthesis tyrosine autokinase [Phragmitibacter flavus]|uniref:non-specific protein-tyrosine kinase n=1 Tax=Phragmitibacter flavus TaxID=2576071 RepID=A0A5R8KAF2_9BACT|nr:polysaccharide biosynthesis tyrosine autokinase [Phragmitibacter flavus]TLD69274.1 polysaccharide biosynthesis tyrosine autokinase [Phragmitibacter flavus]
MDTTKKKFDFAAAVGNALSYAQHGRLMVIMACLGVLAGLCYFVYTTPLYSSNAVIYFRVFGSPLSDKGMGDSAGSQTSALKYLPWELASDSNVLAAAKELGIVGPSASFEAVKSKQLRVRASTMNWSHLQISVMSPDPAVVRVFAKKLIEVYRAQREEAWAKYRNEALIRYAREVDTLEGLAVDSYKDLSKLERESRMTEVKIEQSRLFMVPAELIMTKEVVRRMEEVRLSLDQRGTLGTAPEKLTAEQIFAELSMLTAFEKERELRVGDLLRRQSQQGMVDKPEGAPAQPVPASFVVQPNMVEGLRPWQDLEKKRRVIEEELMEANKRYLPAHAIVKGLEEDLANNTRALAAELEVMRRRFELDFQQQTQKIATLEKRLPEYYQTNEEAGLAGEQYMSASQGRAMWGRARDKLSDKLSMISFTQDLDWVEMHFKEFVNLRDVEPTSPNKMKLLMISLMLAIGGAIGAPTLVNLMHTGVETLQQLENVTGLTAVGVIPRTTKEVLEDIARSPSIGAKSPNHLLESFRLIRSHILLHPNSKGKSQVIMVTSARPSEGKTSQAANLAWAFQSMGSRTLLIDCDLRRGRVHQVLDVANDIGITQLLLNRFPVQEAVLKTSNPLLDVIPRGPIITGTTELLCQKGFVDLVERFRGEYDQIVIDTPPVLGLSETAALRIVVDGVIMVVRAEKTTRRDVSDAVALLRKTDAHFFGMVLNDLDLNKAKNYYNYYYYSASYYEDLEGVGAGGKAVV